MPKECVASAESGQKRVVLRASRVAVVGRVKAIPVRKPSALVDGARSVSRVRASAVARARVTFCSAASFALGMQATMRDRPAVRHASVRYLSIFSVMMLTTAMSLVSS